VQPTRSVRMPEIWHLPESGGLAMRLGNNRKGRQKCPYHVLPASLPHWQKADSALFITWRLYGSLPRNSLASALKELNPGRRFLLLDRELDEARFGPTWLKEDAVAKTCS
jgi:hypothetical protein